MFLEALFFAFEKNFFRVSVHNFGHCRLHEIIGLQLSQCLSANHNPELRCVICAGVTLFALVLHLNCTALSQSESSNFFICIIKPCKYYSPSTIELRVKVQKLTLCSIRLFSYVLKQLLLTSVSENQGCG